jgi:hypothetical protein
VPSSRFLCIHGAPETANSLFPRSAKCRNCRLLPWWSICSNCSLLAGSTICSSQQGSLAHQYMLRKGRHSTPHISPFSTISCCVPLLLYCIFLPSPPNLFGLYSQFLNLAFLHVQALETFVFRICSSFGPHYWTLLWISVSNSIISTGLLFGLLL